MYVLEHFTNVLHSMTYWIPKCELSFNTLARRYVAKYYIRSTLEAIKEVLKHKCEEVLDKFNDMWGIELVYVSIATILD